MENDLSIGGKCVGVLAAALLILVAGGLTNYPRVVTNTSIWSDSSGWAASRA